MLALVLVVALSQTELPPEARQEPGPPEPVPPSLLTRSLLSGGGGVLAGSASLGITMLLMRENPNFDLTFATAGLSSLLITGAVFALHQVLGGQGEITFSFLLTALVMAGSAGIAAAIGGGREITPIYVAAIGSVPAAAAAVFALEITTPKKKRPLTVGLGPTGIYGSF